MKYTYHIEGMSCKGCRKKVEDALNTIDGLSSVVSLDPPVATITTSSPISVDTLQAQLSKVGNYMIKNGEDLEVIPAHKNKSEGRDLYHNKETGNNRTDTMGIFYCPMHCEGEKNYGHSGSCPVCGMDLVKAPDLKSSQAEYACPMHPEIIRNLPGVCPICGMDLVQMENGVEHKDEGYSALKKKFVVAASFTLPIFLISMSEMIPANPLFKIMDLEYWNIVQLIFSLPVIFYATWMFFQRAWKSLTSWKLNMFTLIGIGAGVAWLFSIVALFFPSIFPHQFITHQGTVYVYFEASTVILTLALLGQLLEAKAHQRTTTAIRELLKLAPATATKIVGNKEITVGITEIQKGDLLRVKPGEKIPVDGSIKEGNATIDESMISGEPIPVDKKLGDMLRSGTINSTTTFIMIAEKIGSETLLSRIIEMVNTASRSKAPIQKIADRISGYFVPIVVLISAITFFIWAVYGPEPAYIYAMVNAISVLIIACPCALGLATPMSVMVGIGKGAQMGILIKDAESLEKMNAIDVLIIDKTGTLTEGRPTVERVVSTDPNRIQKDLLQRVVALNSSSEHPLAQATIKYGEEKGITAEKINLFESITGKGVMGILGKEHLALGNKSLMDQVEATIDPDLVNKVSAEQKMGKTVSYLSINGQVAGFVVISDKIKETSRSAIRKLQNEGLSVVMFTGDNSDTAKAVSAHLKLDGFQAQMLPEDKLIEIKKLQASGKKVAMAGDGINDAPALSQADIGIAMGTGTDVAIQSASITLISGDLLGIVKARTLSKKVMSNIKGNLIFALGYNVLGIPVAAGILYPFSGILLSPMVAALAMSLSSVSVILNALRLKNTNI